MDALLIGSTLAAGGMLLNSNDNDNDKPVTNIEKNTDIFDNHILDSKLYERQVMENHLQKANMIQNRPETVRNSSQRDENFLSLSGNMMNKEDFKHNNMQPFYSGELKQNIKGNDNILEKFTGTSDMYVSKKETNPLFNQFKENIHGTQPINEDLKYRYNASHYHQNVPVIDSVRVGPGLNKGYTANPSGGFQQNDALQIAANSAPNIDKLRTKNKQKTSYEGRVVNGFIGTRRGLTPVLNQNRVVRYHKFDEPRFNTTVVQNKEVCRENYMDKNTNRQNTLYSHTPNATPSILKSHESTGAYKNQTSNKQSLTNFGFRNANNTNKESKVMVQYCSDVRKSDAKDNSYVGMVSSAVQKLVLPVQDVLKTTIKETNIHDASAERNFSSITKLSKMYNLDDARTTLKEQLIHNNQNGNISTSRNIHNYDASDNAKTTLKEQLIHDNRIGPIKQLKFSGNLENKEQMKTTARETLKEWITNSNLTGNVRNTAVDIEPLKTTIRETFNEQNRKGIATFAKGQAYTTNTINAPDTSRHELANNENFGQMHNQSHGAYTVKNVVAPDTSRHELSNNEYSGNIEGELKPTSYADIYNATLNELKEGISKGREPTQSGKKSFSHISEIGEVDIKDNLEHRNNLNVNPLQNTSLDSKDLNVSSNNCFENQNDRLENTNLEAYKNNPFTQSLSSTY